MATQRDCQICAATVEAPIASFIRLQKIVAELTMKILKLPTTAIALVGAFAALDIIMEAIPFIPYGPSAGVMMKPIEGIFLGPLAGLVAAFVGGIVSSLIWPSTAVLGLATWIPGVLGALVSGLLFKKRWKLVVLILAGVLVAFFLHPYGRSIFLYANWDKVIALLLVVPVSRVVNRTLGKAVTIKSLVPMVGFISFIATETDGASGNLVFLFMAGPIFGIGPQTLPSLFIPYAFLDAGVRVITGIICALVLSPVLVATRRANLVRWPLT